MTNDQLVLGKHYSYISTFGNIREVVLIGFTPTYGCAEKFPLVLPTDGKKLWDYDNSMHGSVYASCLYEIKRTDEDIAWEAVCDYLTYPLIDAYDWEAAAELHTLILAAIEEARG